MYYLTILSPGYLVTTSFAQALIHMHVQYRNDRFVRQSYRCKKFAVHYVQSDSCMPLEEPGHIP